MPKQLETDYLIKQIKTGMDEFMSPDQKKSFEKINTIYKELLKSSKELGIDNNGKYFQSIQDQLHLLRKDILNNRKNSMSDYEAFLWHYQLCKNQKQIFTFIPKLDLLDKVVLPARCRSLDIQKSNIINKIKSFDFCPLGYSMGDLVFISTQIMFSNPYCQKNFSKQIIFKLSNQISKEYHILSYHNFTHAFSVQLMLFQAFQKTNNLKGLCTQFQIFITYLAALAHDMGHGNFKSILVGTNSDFQVKKKTSIAQLYSNQSVLQNMHIAKFYKMLRRNPEIDIISQIKDPVQRERSKRLLIKLILGTDISKHFDGLNQLKSIESSKTNWQRQQKQIIHQNIFHACDIGNSCLPFQDFLNWAILLSYQFNSQYELQIKDNLSPTQMFKVTDEKAFYKSQIGFINNLVAPLWKTLNAIFPEFSCMIDNLKNNAQHLQLYLTQN